MNKFVMQSDEDEAGEEQRGGDEESGKDCWVREEHAQAGEGGIDEPSLGEAWWRNLPSCVRLASIVWQTGLGGHDRVPSGIACR